jgi:micrococcal nuclease
VATTRSPLRSRFVNRARFQPRRRLSTGVAIALAALVAYRVWESYSDRKPETLEEGHYRVESVTDGDTLVLTNEARVRLIGIDAPEMKSSPRSGGADQPFARDALEFAEQGVEGRKVELQLDKERVDKYGRFLAYVWYVDRKSGEEVLLNEELVRAGLAKAMLRYPYSERMKRRFRAAEQEARDNKRGIWSRRQSSFSADRSVAKIAASTRNFGASRFCYAT